VVAAAVVIQTLAGRGGHREVQQQGRRRRRRRGGCWCARPRELAAAGRQACPPQLLWAAAHARQIEVMMNTTQGYVPLRDLAPLRL
jgi:hypothetical protein